MSVDYLLRVLAESPQFEQVHGLIERGARSIQVEGLAVAAKSIFIASLDRRRPVLIITYNHEQAERLYEDLAAMGVDADDLLLVPPADSTIYHAGDTDLDIVGRRLTALIRLQSDRPGIVIAPIASILQRTIAPELLAAHRMRINLATELDLGECSTRLAKLGYEHVLMVERQGEFSVRGGILDVFPSTEDSPVRVELFGDDVDSIRSFNPETQRSSGARPFIEIAPARELILDPESAESAADELVRVLLAEISRLEGSGNREAAERLKVKVEEDIYRISSCTYFDGIEYYFPAIHADEHSMLDYLPADSLVVLDEPHQIKSHWEQLHEELLQTLSTHIVHGDTLALPMDHVVSFDDAAARLSRCRQKLVLSILPRQLDWLDIEASVPITAAPMDSFSAQIGMFVEQVRTWLSNKLRVILVSNQSHRVIELLGEHDIPVSPPAEIPGRSPAGVYVIDGSLRTGFKLPDALLMVVTDGEMFGLNRLRRPRKAFKKGLAISSLLELNLGDYVVHINHGVGIYRGMTKIPGAAGERDYLLLEYAGVDRLYVPVDQIDRVQKYIGGEGHEPSVNRLGGTEWARTTKRVKAAVKEMAKELVALYAARQSQEGYSFSPDTPWQEEMESAFPYEETPDQLEAIKDIKEDLEAHKPMDRLVCGDVGYGKTEVAIRAVFKVVNDGKQVALLAPTTVLAQQHYNTFRERLAAYPVNINMLSRFNSRAEQKKTIEGLRTGEVDIVIGTHRLLSKDIEFRDLGLVVVDEEQRFGVAHKERLKQLRTTVDVLTLTATPIPRTLHMSLSGIRDMSLINDPPEGRTPVRTYCREFDDEIIRDAVLRELDRDGQVYFVHNRVENIEHIADHIRKLVPYARIEVGHGQMDEDDLERVMLDFYEHRYDMLVCTTIIESGLDIPNVNTIIINNADKLGLAQLYQLRGRVGRSSKQAYAFMLYEPHRVMTEIAEKRLQAIREFTDLGSGFKIALRDLEIRGAGNLLGAEQHGQMSAVGFDMYCRLLSEAIQELKGEEIQQIDLPPADLPMDAYIPSKYIPSESLRLSFYKKMTAIRDQKDIDQIAEELRDRFGDLPKPVSNSIDLLSLRLKAAAANITGISTERGQVTMRFGTGIRLAPDIAKELKRKFQGCVFMADKILVAAGSPRLTKLLGYILDDLPKALDESRDLFLANIY